LDKIREIEFNKKASLIYEYNKNSALFVRTANFEMENNNLNKAIEILKAGLIIYPNHPVAHLLLGKVYALIGDYAGAINYFKKGSNILQSDETYEYYLDELESIRKQRSLLDTGSGNAFLPSSNQTESLATEPDTINQEYELDSREELTVSIDERLEQLADQISEAKLSFSYDGKSSETDILHNFYDDNLIVSETLAKIYIAQNEYYEAIKVYEKLIKKDSVRYEYYTEKIIEIRSMLNS